MSFSLLLTLTGCLYISDEDHAARMDADGDSVDITADCEPDNPDVGVIIWYADADEDGFGDEGDVVTSCDAPAAAGWVIADEAAVDCDDTDGAVHPEAVELCDDVDNNCDGVIDTDADDLLTWYADVDGDGYGDVDVTTLSCSEVDGYVADGTDCDDSAETGAAANPGMVERCDGVDNDCSDATTDAGIATVNGDVTFADLHDAIDTAAELQGATIVLCDGDWVGNFEIEDDMTLTSLNGAKVTTLEGEDDDQSAVWVSGAAVTLSDLTVTNGGGTEGQGGKTGGGIYAGADAELTLIDMIVTGNSATRGGGVGVIEAALTLTGGSISGNTGSGLGGGLFIEGDLPVVITGTTFDGNSGGKGGGIRLDNPQDVTITEVTITGNTATEEGGGIHIERGEVYFGDSTVSGNTAPQGGGISTFEMADLYIEGVDCTGNTSTADGGCAYLVNSTANLENFTVSNNEASSGGGIYYAGPPDRPLNIENSTISNNIATRSGGGATFEGGEVTLENSSVSSNDASENCDLDFDALNISIGGGLSIQDGTQVFVSGSTSISLNTACVGGGVHLDNDSALVGGEKPGDGPDDDGPDGDLAPAVGPAPRVSISGNSATAGGGFAVADTSGASSGLLSDVEFNANTADVYGGGGIVLGELEAVSTGFTDNQAPQGGGIYVLTVAEFGETGFIALIDCDITGNEALISGGGGVHLFGEVELESQGSSWGSGFEDNDPTDITLETVIGASSDYSDYGDDEDFTCSTGLAVLGDCE